MSERLLIKVVALVYGPEHADHTNSFDDLCLDLREAVERKINEALPDNWRVSVDTE